METPAQYDLFISYAHADDTGGTIRALVEEIKVRQQRIDGQPMHIFFDREGIQGMDDWELRILTALRQSRVMIAVLSPAYFESEYCRKEWAWFVDRETERAMTGEAIAPIYTLTVDDFEPSPEAIPDDWPRNLKRRQYLDARPWWDEGAEAFARAEIKERLAELDQRCYEKVRQARHLEGARSTIPPHNPLFVGRSEQIRRIHVAFKEPGPSLVALHGLGGMGKSVLAHEYAHVRAAHYRAGRFLLQAEGQRDLKTLITALATDLGLTLTDEERADPDRAHRRVVAELTQTARAEGSPALVLLDNVDDPDLLARSAVSAALPPRDAVHVIATTRLEEKMLEAATCLEVGALPGPDASRLLDKHRPFAQEDDAAAARKAADAIARRLGGYPLAVEVAAVFLRETPEVQYPGFQARLEQEGIGAVEGAGEESGVQLSRHPETMVSRLLAPTLGGLSEAEALAVQYAAVLPPDAVAVPWLRALSTAEQPGIIPETKPGYPDAWANVVRRLRGLRLLSEGEHPKVMRMHRVVQEVVRERMGTGRADTLRESSFAHAQTRAKEIQDTWTDREARWELTPLLRTAEAALEAEHPGAPTLASFVQSPLHELSRLQEARALLTRAIALQEQTAPSSTGLASNYSNLALIERDLGHLREARTLMQKALAIFEQVLDADHSHLATSYSNLATIEKDLGHLEEARTLMQQAIRIQEAIYDEHHPTLATSYSNLASIEHDLGHLREARTLMQQAIAIDEAAYDDGHPTLARRYSNLAMIEQDLGHLEKAHALMQQAIRIKEAAYDDGHATLATSYSNLAMIERALGHLEKARTLMQQAIRIEEAAYDDGHPHLATSYSNLATIEKKLGHLEEARTLMQQAIRIDEAAYDDGHPTLARRYSNLAEIEWDLGHLEKARTLMHQAIRIGEAAYEEDHPQLARDYSNLAIIEQDLGHLEKARTLMHQAIRIEEAAYDENHPTLAIRYSNLAIIEQDLGHLEKARTLMHQAANIRAQAFGSKHAHTLASIRELAGLARLCGRFEEADRHWARYVSARQRADGTAYDGHILYDFERAKVDLGRAAYDAALQRIQPVLDAWTNGYGPDRVKPALARSVQARALHGLGRHEDAEAILTAIRPIFEAEYGTGHEHVGFLRREIGRVLLAQGRLSAAHEHAEAAREIQAQALPAEHYDLADTYHLLGQIAEAQGRNDDATSWMQKAYAIRSAHTPEHPQTAALRKCLGLHSGT